jgi:hypothetical protein
MDILRDKTYKQRDYTSRYNIVPIYYNTVDQKYMHGITYNLRLDTEYVLHTVTETDDLDKLAFKYYGRPDLYWVIADFNRIQDPYINLFENYNFLYIPSLAGIRYNK